MFKIVQYALPVFAFLAVLLQWNAHPVKSHYFITQVNPLFKIPAFETKYLYWYIHAFTILPILFFSRLLRLPYLKNLSILLISILSVAVPFWIWDIYVTQKGVWGFNPGYFTVLLVNLPVEEWLFFISIPFACLFIYESLEYYKVKNYLQPFQNTITLALAIILIAGGLYYWGRAYTSPTMLLTGAFILYHYLYLPKYYRGRFYLCFLITLIPFLIVDGVLTGTAIEQPIVIYNPEEYIGLRVFTIPVEDIIYSLLMLFSIVTVYEYLLKSRPSPGIRILPEKSGGQL